MSVDLQQRLYATVYGRARSIMGSLPTALVSYEEAFHASLPEAFAISSPEELLTKMSPPTLVLYGDFHSLPSSQAGFASLAANVYRRQKAPLILALECFHAVYQEVLDSYLAGTIDEQQLLQETNYRKTWGFPWSHYRPILEFAKKHQLAVAAINTAGVGKKSLLKRDQFIAQQLQKLVRLHPESIVLCLIGEQHLAETHLPGLLQEQFAAQPGQPQLLRIAHSIDKYYFKILEKPHRSIISCLKLTPNFYCLFHEPPWYKWLSYSLWIDCLQQEHETQGADGEINYSLLSAEVDDHFFEILVLLKRYLGLDINEDLLMNFHIKITPPQTVPTLQASLDYELDPSTKTITWPAFAWDGLIKAAGEFLFHCAHSSTHQEPGLPAGPGSDLARATASRLLLRLLNPSLSYLPVGLEQAAAKQGDLRQERNGAQTSLSSCASPSSLTRSYSDLLARQLYLQWEEDRVFFPQLQSIFKSTCPSFTAFINLSLPFFLQQHPAPNLYRADDKDGKNG